MRYFVALALVCFAFALALPAAQAQRSAAVPAQTVDLPGEFMGMVVRDPHYEWKTNPAYPGTNVAFYEQMGKNLQSVGVKWVRIEFFAEEFDDPATASDERGSVRPDKYSYFVNVIAPKYGFKVIGLLATPLVRWQAGAAQGQYLNPELLEAPTDDPPSNSPAACGKPSNQNAYLYGCGTNPYMRIYLNNAFTIAQQLPYNAATGAGVAAFEVLNEQNRYLNGGGKGIKPESVATLLTKFYRIYKNDRCAAGTIGGDCAQVRILLGGLHPGKCDDCITTATPGGMNDRQYLNTIYKSAAFQSYRNTPAFNRFPVDGIGYHPYPMEIRNDLVPEETGIRALDRVPQRIRNIRQVMLDNGDSANKLWITEVGDRGAPNDPDNQKRQSDFMRVMYWMLWQQRESIQTALWFKYEDFAVPADPNAVGPENWGVVRLMPHTPTASCPTCEYAADGSVQVFKQSYVTFQDIAANGVGPVRQSFMPLFGDQAMTPAPTQP